MKTSAYVIFPILALVVTARADTIRPVSAVRGVSPEEVRRFVAPPKQAAANDSMALRSDVNLS